MEKKDKLTITSEDEKIVEERLHEFSINIKPEEAGVIRLSPSMLVDQSDEETSEEESTNERVEILNMKEKITESSFSPNYNIIFYTYSAKKKIFDFIAGFITVFAMYCFLNFQPLIIFLIFLIGAMETVLAFKSNRMYIVWGFIWGSIFSSSLALFLSLSVIYFPSNPFVAKILNLFGK
ncbi:MAG: hypothetical protein PHR47_01940 [Candidatus Pacebacteria bacterium]|nr:hypothetical protein [Candidatus Paceibacterota bacterium]